MPLQKDQAADYQAVFDYFGVKASDRPAESWYLYAPVFRTVIAGVPAAVKRTRKPKAAAAIARWARALAGSGIAVVTPIQLAVQNPALINDQMWVAYPWIDGRPYAGSNGDIAAAGDMLGRMHAQTQYFDADLPKFKWPEHDQASVDEDVEDLTRVLESRAPEIAGSVLARAKRLHRTFMTDTLPIIRGSSLPFVVGTTDFRASNVVYTAAGPALIDPDNADYLPRTLDFAIAALLFHSAFDGAPSRLFNEDEWEIFNRAYLAQAHLSELEFALWPTALKYIVSEWGTWALIASDEWDDWADPHHYKFLVDLAQVDLNRFPFKQVEASPEL